MKHALNELQIALDTLTNNEPIHRAEGRTEQADAALVSIEDIKNAMQALARLHAFPPRVVAEDGTSRSVVAHGSRGGLNHFDEREPVRLAMPSHTDDDRRRFITEAKQRAAERVEKWFAAHDAYGNALTEPGDHQQVAAENQGFEILGEEVLSDPNAFGYLFRMAVQRNGKRKDAMCAFSELAQFGPRTKEEARASAMAELRKAYADDDRQQDA